MKDHYIHAVLEMLENGADVHTVLSGLSATLQKKGHTRLHGAVLRGVLRILESKRGTRGATVTVARESAVSEKKHAIEQALAQLGASSDYRVVVDPSIIGGTIVEHNNVLIDTSYKTRLVKLYRSITK